MSNADNVQISALKEAAWGVQEVGNYVETLVLSDTLKNTAGSVQSAVITGDRNVRKIVRTSLNCGGDLPYEMIARMFDSLFEGTFLTVWTAAVRHMDDNENVAVTFDAGGGVSVPGATNTFASVAVGEMIVFRGLTSTLLPMNNRMWRVTAKADSDNITVAGGIIMTAGTQAGSAATANTTVYTPKYLSPGSTVISHSIQKAWLDLAVLTDRWEVFRGMMVDTFSMAVPTNGIVSGSFSFLGKLGTLFSSDQGGSIVTAPTHDSMASVDEAKDIMVGTLTAGAANGLQTAQAFSFQLSNNLRQRLAIAQLGPSSIGTGKAVFTGNLTLDFNDIDADDFRSYFNDWTKTPVYLEMADADTNVMMWEFPDVRHTDNGTPTSGENTDVNQEITWAAEKDATLLYAGRLWQLDFNEATQ